MSYRMSIYASATENAVKAISKMPGKAKELDCNMGFVKAYLKDFQFNFEEIPRSEKAFTEPS